MPLTVEDHLAHLRRLPSVQAICQCGSYRTGLYDDYSDLDVWVFVRDEQPLNDSLAEREFLPADAAVEVLAEGRDDTLVDHLVLNVLTDRLILNLKILHTRVLAHFCVRPPNLDESYLEDLENYWTMQVLYDPRGIVGGYKNWLYEHAVGRIAIWMTPQVIARYSNTYWRSVYQGVLRGEKHSWRHLATSLLELLTWLAHLRAGRLPTPRKWLFAERVLRELPTGAAITALLDCLWKVDVTDNNAVLSFYVALNHLEQQILDPSDLPYKFWWRAVFTKRIPTLAVVTDLGDLPAQIAHVGIAHPDTL